VAEREVQSAQRRARTRERAAQRDLEARIDARKASAEAEAASEAKRLRLKRRYDMTDAIIAGALARLREAPRDDAYLDLLFQLAREAVSELGVKEAVLVVSTEDREFLSQAGRFDSLAERLSEEAGAKATLSVETIDTAGGLVVVTEDGKVIYHNTFEEIAYRVGSRLRDTIADELFG
jgi:vacuolar-type H+-ATPase subunit E/Vma4